MTFVVTRIVFALMLFKIVMLLRSDLKLKHGILKVDDYSREYFENPILYNFWYNKTLQCANGSVTIIKEVGNQLRLNTSIYKWVKNKWRPFPIPPNPAYEIFRNPCVAIKRNIMNIQMYSAHYGITDCPIPKGIYEVHNVYVDEDNFPPHTVPYGKYRITASAYMLNTGKDIISGQYELEAIRVK